MKTTLLPTRLAAAALAASALLLPSRAQTPRSGVAAPTIARTGDDPIALAAVTVTGSNIRGVDTEKTLPVSVYTADEIALSGVSTMSELVETLPFSTNVSINETATGPNDARGDVSTINLRNLGAGRTLVLLNGRRLSAYGVTPGTPPVQFVNVNAIPFGAVQQVEVLRDGASAIYGSDAIGGVVNTIMKKKYEGFEADVRYAFASDGGSPRETTATIAGGRSFNGGRTSVTLMYSFYHRDLTMATERDYAANADKRPLVDAPFNTNANFNNLNSSSPYGRFTAVNDAGTATSVAGVTATNGQFYYDPTTGARATGAGPTGFYNSQAGTQLLPTIDRHNVFATVDHKVSAALSLFGELSYYDSHSFGQFDASPISLATDGIVIPKTNYYNPVGTRFYGPGTANPTGTPLNVSIRNYRATDIGPRSYDTDSDSYRLLAGVRGDVAGSTWAWEAAGMYMRGETYQVNHGYISQSRFLQTLARSTPDAYNPFGGTNPESVWRDFTIDIWDRGVGTLTSFDAKTSGQLYRLPGGAISLAVGGEYRREAMEQRNDPFGLADDVVAQSEQLDVDASRDVYGGFAEVLVPLVGADNSLPLLEQLELRVAGRYEHYKAFDATKPGGGLSWRPTKWLLLRASYNEGFRAPTVVELFTPAIGRRNDGIVDPARPGQPDAAGSVSKRVVTGGNPGLQPEESESYNYGIVVDVPFLKGLSFGADLYRIKQYNQIDNSSAVDELNLDAQLWRAGGGSNPRVIRAARTAADIAAGLPGVLVEVQSTYQNLSLREVRGADLFANYRTPRFSFGRFNFTASASYTHRLFSVTQQGTVTDLVRNNGNPRAKVAAGVSWSLRNWSASVAQRVTTDYRAPIAYATAGEPFIVDEYWVTNASLGYSFRSGLLKNVRLRVGANNVFDEAPPLYPVNSSGYHPSYADPRGRVLYVDASYKF